MVEFFNFLIGLFGFIILFYILFVKSNKKEKFLGFFFKILFFIGGIAFIFYVDGFFNKLYGLSVILIAIFYEKIWLNFKKGCEKIEVLFDK